MPVSRGWSRSILAVAGAALPLAAAACSGAGATPSPAPSHGAAIAIGTGVNPAGIAVGDGFAWIANAGDGTVSKVDLVTNKTVGRVVVGDPAGLANCGSHNVHQTPHGDFRIRNCDLPKAVAVSPGAVWAGKGDTQSLVRIDPKNDSVVATIPVRVEAWYILATASAVWLADWRANTVVRVDPATNRVVATVANLPNGPTGMALSPGALWVACSRDNVLARIDTTTDQVTGTVPTDLTPLPVLYAYGSVWVRNEFREGVGSVQRIDPATGHVVATVPVTPVAGRDGIDSLAALDGGVWVAGLELERIDPATNRVGRRINHIANAVTSGVGDLWTIDIAYSVSRIAP